MHLDLGFRFLRGFKPSKVFYPKPVNPASSLIRPCIWTLGSQTSRAHVGATFQAARAACSHPQADLCTLSQAGQHDEGLSPRAGPPPNPQSLLLDLIPCTGLIMSERV